MENDLDSPEVHFLALAARTAVENGDLDAAERHYQKLTRQSSAPSEWFASLGYVQLQLGRFEDAVGSMTAAASGSPEDAGVLTGLGNALLRLGRIEASLDALQRAVKLAPHRIDTLNALGLAYAASGSIEVASETFASALALAPDATAVLTNWIDILMRAQRAEQASVVLEQLVLDRPDDAAAWFKLGQVQMSIGRLSQAAHALERSAQLIPTHSPTFQNLGLVAMWVVKTPEAEAYFRKALALDASNGDARFGLATTLLKQRKAREGWALFAMGRASAVGAALQPVRGRRWDGATIERGALLVLADQGLGDVLQFARFLQAARARAPRLIVYCADYHFPLAPLLATVKGVDAVVNRSSGPQEIGAYAEMSALPHLLGSGSTAFEPIERYLTPQEAAVRRWARRIEILDGIKVGLCWAGNSRPDYAEANRIDVRRSLNGSELGSLSRISGASFVSLQKGAGRRRPGFDLVDWTDDLVDYGETAALIANLDLVISVDTSIVHCAGAVGTPVWMLDRFDNCWRWGSDEMRPGWYQNLRVFRQPSPGAWSAAIDRMLAALEEWIAAQRRS